MPDIRPTVSVVIAVRNGEQTVRDAVSSALCQSSPATEVIVVDDMSEDGTRERVLELEDERVMLLDGEGRGVAAARNIGIERATGEWIAFLDGDDRWQPEFLELARLRICAAHGAVACFGAAVPVDDHGHPVGRHDVPASVTREALLLGQVVPTTSATLALRSAIAECGGFYEGFARRAGVEDLDLWWRLAALGPCIGVSRPAAIYVVHDERDRERSPGALSELEGDRELAVTRLAGSDVPTPLLRRARAIMRARTARYWLRARQPARARAVALSSLRALPTLEGCITLAVASVPQALRERLVEIRRRHRSAGVARGVRR
jgi:GT2 family glycosyltransferase